MITKLYLCIIYNCKKVGSFIKFIVKKGSMAITNAFISTGNLKLVLSCFQGVENAYIYTKAFSRNAFFS